MMTARANYTAILDIGKTNIKCHVLTGEGKTTWSRSMPNRVVDRAPYPHFDTETTWRWFLQVLADAARDCRIEAINVSTHGACGVLLDGRGEPVLPVLDYEHPGPEAVNEDYRAVRPPFADTLSPALPMGLNLGRQLYWLRETHPEAFAAAKLVLMYPQYWVYRLTGVAVNEVTSLGCHTDLWCPGSGDYSGLIDILALRERLPPLTPAHVAVGKISETVAEYTGLPEDCLVYPGVHDSNAGFARYLYAAPSAEFSVVSTGTWIISLARGARLEGLVEAEDTLANVNVLGEPVPCARFMGGREFEAICRLTHVEAGADYTDADVQSLLDKQVFALPAFAEGGGPFQGRRGEITGMANNGKALASLYTALMIDYELDLLAASGDILFGSASGKNPLMCSLLAQLRPDSRVMLSGDDAATVTGAWCLTRWKTPAPARLSRFQQAKATALTGLEDYREAWRARSALPR